MPAQPDAGAAIQLLRQVQHWTAAADRLSRLEDLAAESAWAALETELGVAVRASLCRSVARLCVEGSALRAALGHAGADDELEALQRRLVRFRQLYLRTETVVDFYADCVNTRTNSRIAAQLQAIDILARRAMSDLLSQVGQPTPPVLTYLDRGLGASILKAGLRLWDGSTDNPAAVIKVVRHALFRPTSLVHEVGHQVAHITGWSEDLGRLLYLRLAPVSPTQGALWRGWASELAADTYAFAHCGYAAVAGLADVLAADESMVFHYRLSDPHPVAFLRVLLGVEMCTTCYGAGPWDALATTWRRSYPLDSAPEELKGALARALPLLPEIAALLLHGRIAAFSDRALTDFIDPARVSPQALRALAARAGPALFVSQHWVVAEPLRLLALTGLEIATEPERTDELLRQQDNWMRRLSGYAVAA